MPGIAPLGRRVAGAVAGRFTTHNYQLTVHIPPGLFRCRYPAGWVGLDHGIILYLDLPHACDPGGAVAADKEAGQLPQVSFFYSYDVVAASVGATLAAVNSFTPKPVVPQIIYVPAVAAPGLK